MPSFKLVGLGRWQCHELRQRIRTGVDLGVSSVSVRLSLKLLWEHLGKKLSAVSLKIKAEVGARDTNQEVVNREVVVGPKNRWDYPGRWCIMSVPGQGWVPGAH